MTVDEVLALPPAPTFKQANKAFNLSDSTGYALHKRGEYPIEVLAWGRCLRVRRSDILKTLGIQDDREERKAEKHDDAGAGTPTPSHEITLQTH